MLDFPTRHLRNVLTDLMPDKLPLLDLPASEKINLGSGEEDHGIDSDFINVDLIYTDAWIARKNIDANLVRGDISKLGDRFESQSLSVLYSHHTIEHIDRRDIPKTLKHWLSLLKQGGIMYVGVPDSKKCIEMAERNSVLWDQLNGIMLQNGNHKAVLWESMLVRLLKNAGFQDVKVWKKDRSKMKLLAEVEVCAIGVKR